MDEDLALGVDFEDGAAAVTDEEIAFRVKDATCGDAHAFGVERRLASTVDAVNIALSARGDIELSIGAEGEAGSIEQASCEGSATAVGADAHYGDRCLLATRAGDGGVDHAGAADGGTGNGMQTVREEMCDAQW